MERVGGGPERRRKMEEIIVVGGKVERILLLTIDGKVCEIVFHNKKRQTLVMQHCHRVVMIPRKVC